MTSAEIADLRDFISGELGKIHSRLDAIDGRLGRVEAAVSELRDAQHGFRDQFADVSTRRTSVEVVGEAMRHDFKAFGEGLAGMDRKVDVLRLDMNSGFGALRDEMKFGFLAYDEPMNAVEVRVEHWEAER